MARRKTIEQLRSGAVVGHVGLGIYGGQVGTVRRQVYDGDTINVRALGNFGVRFLGIDTAEMKIPLPGERTFTSLSSPRWDAFLSDPFAAGGPLSSSQFSNQLINNLQARSGPGVAANHRRFAEMAEDALEDFVQNDMSEMGVAEEEFEFFLRFAFEIMDRYGRFLCYINRNQPNANFPSPRPQSYNLRILQTGLALPYFIWPNINPWRARGSILKAVMPPGSALTQAESDPALRDAQQAVRDARNGHLGVFETNDPLQLEPFEIRFLSRTVPPDRRVIDLSKNDNVLLHPENYHQVNSEDRLFISTEHVPLFLQADWQMEGSL